MAESQDLYALRDRAAEKAQLNDYRGAVADLTELLKLDPKDVNALRQRCAAKLKLKDYQGALADSAEMLKLDSKDAIALRTRGAAKLKLNDYQGAVDDSTELLKLDPQDAIALRTRGAAKLQLTDYSDAVADCREALTMDPEGVGLRDARACAEQWLANAVAAAFAAESELLAEVEGDSVCKHNKTSKKANKKTTTVAQLQNSRSSADVESHALRSGAHPACDVDLFKGSSVNCTMSACSTGIEKVSLDGTLVDSPVSHLSAEPALLRGKKRRERAKRKKKQLEQKAKHNAYVAVDVAIDEELVEEACVDKIGAPQAKVVVPIHEVGASSEFCSGVLEPVQSQVGAMSRSSCDLPHMRSSSSSSGAQNTVVADPRLEIISVFEGLNLSAEVARRLTDPDGDYNYSDLVSFARLVEYQDLRDAGLQVADARLLMANLKTGGDTYNRLADSEEEFDGGNPNDGS